jgi:hypothetical protein
MNIIQKTPGPNIDYEISGTKITFADDELTLNLAKYERDDPAHIDICMVKFGMLVTGVIPGIADKYVAEIDIPARRYTEVVTPSEEESDEDVTERVPVPFDMDECTLYLWGLED